MKQNIKYNKIIEVVKRSSQELAVHTKADETLLCGTRGSMKTISQLLAFVKYVGRGYGHFWRGIIFDQEYRFLDDIIKKSWQLFKPLGAEYNKSEKQWTFRTGETLVFRKMKVDDDYWDFHGHEYCLEDNEEILTENGYKAIKDIQVGEKLLTLDNGYQKVSKKFDVGFKNCVKVSVYTLNGHLYSEQLQSEHHHLLTSDAKFEIQQLERLKSVPLFVETTALLKDEKKYLDDVYQENRSFFVELVCGEIYAILLRMLRQNIQQDRSCRRELGLLLVVLLYNLAILQRKPTLYRSVLKSSVRSLVRKVNRLEILSGRPHIQELMQRVFHHLSLNLNVLQEDDFVAWRKVLNLINRCFVDFGLSDELAHIGIKNDLYSVLSQLDEEDNNLEKTLGVLEDVLKHIHLSQYEFSHPYQKGKQCCSNLQLSLGFVFVRSYKKLHCFDVEVETSNHYVTKSGLVNKNCFIGFNELTKYPTSYLYDMIGSCLRSGFKPELNAIIDEKGNRRYLPPIPLLMLSTTNPNGCVPYGEVLTENRGWVDIQNVIVGERVLSMDKNGIAKYCIVSKVHKYEDWHGTMIVKKGRGVNLEFTSDHRLPYKATVKYNKNTTSPKSYEIRSFEDMPNEIFLPRKNNRWFGEKIKTFTVPNVKLYRKNKLNQPLTIDGDLYCEFMGWFLSEGSVLLRDKEFQISQSKIQNRECIKTLLDKIGFSYRTTFQSFIVSSPEWVSYLSQFGKCRNKFIPDIVKNATVEQLNLFVKTIMLGDGSKKTYYTLSKQLADDMCEIFWKIGKNVYLSKRLNRSQLKNNINEYVYQVNYHDFKYTVLRKNSNDIIYENCKKPVYCLTVPETEMFVIRQKGCVWVSGNSGHNWVKRRFIDVAPYGHVITNESEVYDTAKDEIVKVRRTQVAIFSSFLENPYLDNKTKMFYLNYPDPNIRKAWALGSWDITSGGMFGDLWEKNIHVIPRFAIPKSWYVDRTFDWGSTHPFSVGWWARANGEEVDVLQDDGTWTKFCPPKGSLIQIYEYYGADELGTNRGSQMGARDIARNVAEIDARLKESGWVRGEINAGAADNQIWNNINVDNPSIAGIMESEGVYWERSDKSSGSRINGCQIMRDMLADTKNANSDAPHIYFMRNCVASIGTIPILPRDEKVSDDADTNAEDHPWDMTRYRILDAVNKGEIIRVQY